ncbi:MAG: ATP-grasp domain-containing protein [Desulfovibrionaceae bacterium]|nr:ATP-grasp domain-containing protein [Desulfovibrionaceae bacterium]
MNDIIFTNVRLDPDTYYVFYVGEMKAYGLNEFVHQAIGRHTERKTRIISIVSDVLEDYPHDNIIVINPEAFAQGITARSRVSMRIPITRFARHVSANAFVRETASSILQSQDELYVWMFESKPEFTLTRIPGVRLLGPDPLLAAKFNNKIWQYNTFRGHIPIPDYQICHGATQLAELTARLRPEWADGIFVSLEYSAAGMGSMVTRTQEDVTGRFTDEEAYCFVSRYMIHDYDPTVLAVVANEDDVFVAGVADQRIENGNAFRGSTFPSVLDVRVQEELCEHTRTVGRLLGKRGYRGIFGCDFIVTPDGRPFFIEANTRKQGTTMEFCCAMENLLPEGSPNLLELEYFAVTRNRFPENTPASPECLDASCGCKLHWGTYNNKVDHSIRTAHNIYQTMGERDLFRRAASGGSGGHLILEHVGTDMIVKPGTFLGRVVAVDSSRRRMLERLRQGEEQLMRSVRAEA